MLILINVSSVFPNPRGMGIFTKEILNELIKIDNNQYIFVAANELDEEFKKQIQNHKTIIVKTPLPIFEQIVLPFLITKYVPDICWFPSNTFPLIKPVKTKYVATIHDLIFFKRGYQKSFYQKIGKIYRSINIRYGFSKIDCVTSVSQSSLIEIYQYFRKDIKVEQSKVLYNSIDVSNLETIDNNIIRELGLTDKKFIYTISGSSYNKNLDFLIKAFKKFNLDGDYILVVSGLKENEKKFFQSRNVIFTKYISVAKKNALLTNASLFVMASLDEGFGIPLIEGMYFNDNVAASNIDVFKEIGEEYVWYFNPTDVDFLINYFSDYQNMFSQESKISRHREYINNKFSKKLTVEKIKAIFEDNCNG